MNYDKLTQARCHAERVHSWINSYMASIRARTKTSDNTTTVTYRALHDWSASLRYIQRMVDVPRVEKTKVRVLFQPRAAWIGVHYSEANLRWCINLLPFVTVCITKKGGVAP